jgi:YbbR domain-containing protein
VNLLKRFYRIVSHNLPWKLAALFASTTLWIAINGSEPNADRYLTLTVMPVGLAKHLVVADQDTSTVEVQLRGPRSILRTIDEEDHRVALNLRGAEAGDVTMKITADMLDFPRRVRVVQINPPQIKVHIQRLLTKSIPVRAVLVPERRNGYTLSDATVTPANVEVSGPSSRVDRLQVIETEPISTFVDGKVERDVALAGAGKWLSYSPNTVRVAFTVSEVEGRRTLKNVAVALHAAVAGSTLDPAAVEVTVRGPEHRLASLKAGDVASYVDGEGVGPGTHVVTPQITLPEGLRLDAVSPAALRLKVPEAASGGADKGPDPTDQ